MIDWYAVTPDLGLSERGPVDLAAALGVVDGYFARLKPRYESGEEALAETMFGFQRATDDMLEICLHRHDHISVHVELPEARGGGLFARFRRGFQHDRELRSRDEVHALVTAYFDLTPEKFRQRFAGDES